MSEPTSNPYATPVAEVAADATLPNGYIDFGAIVCRWERLRIVYNMVLAALVLMLTFGVYVKHIPNPVYWLSILLGACVANLCFFLGPAAEGYGTRFRFWHPWCTNLLFVAGLGLTAILAIGSIVTFR